MKAPPVAGTLSLLALLIFECGRIDPDERDAGAEAAPDSDSGDADAAPYCPCAGPPLPDGGHYSVQGDCYPWPACDAAAGCACLADVETSCQPFPYKYRCEVIKGCFVLFCGGPGN